MEKNLLRALDRYDAGDDDNVEKRLANLMSYVERHVSRSRTLESIKTLAEHLAFDAFQAGVSHGKNISQSGGTKAKYDKLAMVATVRREQIPDWQSVKSRWRCGEKTAKDVIKLAYPKAAVID